MIVPERSSQVRRLKVDKRWIGYGLLGFAGLFALASFLFIHYLYVVQDVSENRRLKEDNLQIRAQLKSLRDRVDQASDTLERIDRFTVKLPSITQPSASDRSLAIGPVVDRVDQ